MAEKDIDEISGVETTGHEWDGIKELNNPLPRWWVWTFYVTVIWAIAYTIAYPAWPLLSTNTKGLLGWSSRGDVETSIADAEAARGTQLAALRDNDIDAIMANADLRQFATSAGAAAFKVNCVQCHGSGAAGGAGYPNLNDDDWIWGGTPDDIYTTLTHGIRYEQDDDTRVSDMPAFGADELLDAQQISDVAWYVRKISGQETDEAAATNGQVVFAEQCASCHGENGEGMKELGAPALNDAIWLYDGSHEGIVAQVNKPKQGVMPAWGARLGDTTVKQLTVYVHSLGGGE